MPIIKQILPTALALTGATLASNILASSLTSVGTLSGLTVTAAPTFSAMTAGSILFAGTAGLLSQDNANFFWDATNHRLGIGTVSPAGLLNLTQAVIASAAPTSALIITTGAHTALTASTEYTAFNLNGSASYQIATGALTTNRFGLFQGPTVTAVGTTTITTYVGWDFTSAAPGTNVTITSNYGIRTTASHAAAIPLIIKGAASQTGNLVQHQNSGGTVIGGRDKNGSIFGSCASFNAGTNIPANGISGAVARGIEVRSDDVNGYVGLNLLRSDGTTGLVLYNWGQQWHSYITCPFSGSDLYIYSGAGAGISISHTNGNVSLGGTLAVTGGIADATNIALGTGTGTKIGTATSQKLGFFNSTPVVQQSGDIGTALTTLGLITTSPSLSVANGGTGGSSFTAYTVLCGGTTATGALQSVANVGASGQVFTSYGSGVLPTWTTSSGGGASVGNPGGGAQVDITGANGSASTALRTDCKLILDQTIAPTMTGAWTFTNTPTLGSGVNINTHVTTGTKMAATTSQKLGFWGKTPIVQPSGANQAALTDSTLGTPSFTLNQSFLDSVTNDNIATLNRQLDAIRTALVNAGIIKGAA